MDRGLSHSPERLPDGQVRETSSEVVKLRTAENERLEKAFKGREATGVRTPNSMGFFPHVLGDPSHRDIISQLWAVYWKPNTNVHRTV